MWTYSVDLVVVQGDGSADGIVKVADLGVDGLVPCSLLVGERGDHLLDSGNQDFALGGYQLGHWSARLMLAPRIHYDGLVVSLLKVTKSVMGSWTAAPNTIRSVISQK